jgi:nucleotide-binding universal stress UspA family protein
MRHTAFPKSKTGWLAVDGSLASRSAALIGLNIAFPLGLQLRSISLGADPPWSARPSSDNLAEMRFLARDKTRPQPEGVTSQATTRALQWLGGQALLTQVSLSMHVELGGVTPRLTQLTAESAFLSMGRRGVLHQGEIGYLGQDLLAVAGRSGSPLLIGGEQAPSSTIHKLILADDFQPASARAGAWAAHLQRNLSCIVGIVTLDPEPDWDAPVAAETPPSLEESASQPEKPDSVNLGRRQKRSAEIILSAAEKTHTDLIIMGCRRPHLSDRGARGRLIDLLRICELPVLAVF